MFRQQCEIAFGCERAATARLVQCALNISGYSIMFFFFFPPNSADENYGFGKDIGKHFLDANDPR